MELQEHYELCTEMGLTRRGLVGGLKKTMTTIDQKSRYLGPRFEFGTSRKRSISAKLGPY